MPKINTGNAVAIAALLVALLGGIIAGVGGTTAWGAICQKVEGNTESIAKVERDCDGLTPAVIELRIAVAKLTEQIESHQHTAHLHEGDD